MNNAPFQDLFSQVNNLFARYEEINELTGDHFNVFKILKLESSEVRMHSAFLAELLNPKGSHGQKNVFLKLFIEKFCYKKNFIDVEHCYVLIEKYLGPKSAEDTTGGRLDICIRDKDDNFIVIENKIYAPEQPKQLERYHQHHPNADLFYLTLDGTPPSNESKGYLSEEKGDFRCLSYQSDIIEWLNACRKEVAVLPIVREAITHYINLIKHLTNQTTNHNMEKELTKIMQKNLKASFAIAGNLTNATQIAADAFGEKVITEIENIGLRCSCNIDFSTNYTGIWIWNPKWKYVNIGFQFHSKNHNMIYGFTIKTIDGKNPIPIDPELKLTLKELSNNEKRNNDWWPWFNYMEAEYGDWNKAEAYEAMDNGSMLKLLVERTKKLIEMTAKIEL